MLPSFLAVFLLLSPVPVCQPELSEGSDTLKAARVSSTAGSIIVPQRISSAELKTVTGVSEAVRRFAGVQLRDYGGVGGLKTVNVRSLGSEHTGVFIDGIQVDNAQNMQVDLGRFGLEGLGSISLFSGQKVSPLQSAKEYSSASSLYLESTAPSFKDGSEDHLSIGVRAGSFSTVSPSATWEHLFKSGTSLRLDGEAVGSSGRYRFHVSDYRTYPDGTVQGYDTTMVRQNCDLRSMRLEGRLFGAPSENGSWNVHAYFYDSERGLPGPVYKRMEEYPLSEDRQADRDFFIQGRFNRALGRRWTISGRAKYSFSHLEYSDVPEIRPDKPAARFNYRNHSAYVSGTASARLSGWLRLNLAQDFQYDYLDADMAGFAFPGRLSSWSCASLLASSGPFEASATLLDLNIHDTFLSGGSRSAAGRGVLMPSLVARWKPSGRFQANGFVKRSFRMPTFNDLYYTTVGSKSLKPEDAFQADLGMEWTAVRSGRHGLSLKVDAYRNILKNKIIAVPTSNQFRWSMYNLGKVRVTGCDLVADYASRGGLLAFGGTARYTFQSAVDSSEGRGQVPYIPRHSGSANVFGELSRWRLDVTAFASGERYTTSVNLPAYRLAPWMTLDAALSRTLRIGGPASRYPQALDLKLCFNNILGRQYEVVDNYPMPGFNFLLKVIYNIGVF